MIIYVSPTIFFGPLVYRLKKLWNANSYLVLRDFFPQWAIDSNLISKYSPLTYFFKFFERINYVAADFIGMMSHNNLEWFKSYYNADKSLEVLYNWSVINLILDDSPNNYRKEFGLSNKVVFFYGGTFGHAQDMMNLIRLAKNMQNDERAHFVFVGDGDELNLIKESILNYGLQNLTLLPSVNQKIYNKMLNEFDVGLFTLNKNHKTHNFPGKTLGYMLNEKPILGSVNYGNDLKDIVEKFNAGFISFNGEDDLLVANARKLLSANLREQIGKNAKKLLIDKFSVRVASKQILKKL